MNPLHGRCLCGDLRVELTPPTDFFSHCHCTSCRRASAAAFLTWTSVPLERFAMTGEVRWYRSSATIEWGSCARCSSTVLYRAVSEGHAESPKTDRMYVTVASLTDPMDRAPLAHVSFEEHVAWFEPGDALPKHVGKTAERIPGGAPMTVLYVADQQAAARFYTAVLQVDPLLDVPGMTELPLPGGASLGLMPEAGIARLLGIDPAGTTPRAELYLRVPDAAAAHARALENGAIELSALAPRDWGDTVAYSQDPDGHVLAFSERR